MEALQDFLNPANDNIPIVEDPKTGDVSLSGDTSVEIKDQPSFLELLRVGETKEVEIYSGFRNVEVGMKVMD